MRTILDKAGRILIPIEIWEKLRLKPGTVFKVAIVGDKIELEQELSKVQYSRAGESSAM
ncbi:MAG: hypothetical protein IAE77_28580 [Prosthecobacter sp.]|uniref:hypothetical protein n=1 Tax=Prosthecobacter sp. TaxID=1965333 RepID=UPI0019E1267A|nr:hypothetical protein [Prosthecobacter sp.]MBE2287445.1 hypothetical protein [Prosthecobacter sp.]